MYKQAKQTRSDILYTTTLDTGRCSHYAYPLTAVWGYMRLGYGEPFYESGAPLPALITAKEDVRPKYLSAVRLLRLGLGGQPFESPGMWKKGLMFQHGSKSVVRSSPKGFLVSLRPKQGARA